MCNNYLQETAIKISVRFSFKTYNNLKMIDLMVYIKCGLLLKVIISVFNAPIKNSLPCNCRKKHECPLDGKCRAENIVYKGVSSVHGILKKFI